MDPIKINGITSWPVPQCKRDVQSFLGFCNFYRRFIQGYARIAHPLTSLTGISPWHWDDEQQTSFEKMKTLITTAPILSIPTDDDPFRIEADASEYAVGAVLSQKQDNKWKPIAFMSKALNPTQRNYEVYDREMLAIMIALTEWRKYLMGAVHDIEIFTDHQNLQYFRKPQKLNRRQARWLTELTEYHYTLHHIPGKQNTKADALSRRPDLNEGVDTDNENETLLKPEIIRSIVEDQAFELDLQTQSKEIYAQIKATSNNREPKVDKALENKEPGWKKLDNGLITFRERLYVPKNSKLRERIIRENHDSIVAGHPGRYKTAELVTRNYWWPRVQHDIREYVEGCETCQRVKTHRQPLAAPLHPHDIPDRPWEIISLDLIGPLPESNGYNAILVIVDRFTKMIKLEPTQVELSSEGFARSLLNRVFRDHGLPRKIIHDRDTRFTSEYIRELFRLLGIKQNPSTAYHPITDGQTERMNQGIEEYLRIFINHQQSDWSQWIALAEFCYNNREHTATKQTPFFLNHGQHPWTGTEVRRETKYHNVEQFKENLDHARQDAQAALNFANDTMKRQYDKHRRPAIDYKPGDKVYIEGTNIRSDRPTKKLEDRRYGPFPIDKKIGRSAYKVTLPPLWRGIHPVFNESLLTPYKKPTYPSQRPPPPPPPIIVEGEQEYEVEFIRDSKYKRRKLHYLVHWKGYRREDDTWEPLENVKNVPLLIAQFHKDHPNRPKQPVEPQRLRFLQLFPVDPDQKPDAKGPLFDWIKRAFVGQPKDVPEPEHPTDIVLYIKPEHMDRIANGTKNHDYRKYELPSTIKRIWFHENLPTDAITFMAVTASAKRPGEVKDPTGIGNDDFDKGLKESKFGYPILELYQFSNPLTRKILRGRYGLIPPLMHYQPPTWLHRDYPSSRLKRLR
jgi:hypothetical protein